MSKRIGLLTRNLLLYGAVLAVCLWSIVPFVWMISGSFKDRGEIFTWPPVLIPRQPTFHGYQQLAGEAMFAGVGYVNFLLNSLSVAVATSFVVVAFASLAAYGMSRFRYRGSTALKYTILFSQMLPGALLLLPLYLFMRDVKLLDTLRALVIVYVAFGLPYNTYIIKGYLDSIPHELDEQAMIDGCGRFEALVKVILPVAGPGLAATTISAFITGWNEFMFALVFLNTYRKWTMPLALSTFRAQYLVQWGYLFAGSTLVTLPVIALFLVLQRHLASGLVAGAMNK
jgi:ABC-type glycerol-3-phosphate transport system permease component